jgi:TMEM175 potassium channel family protein
MQERDLARVVAFTDGVMAVAITLLVLNLDVPDVEHGEIGNALVDLLPSFGAYLLSFALIGRYWVIHHNLFEHLRAFDGRLMALNLLFLSLIALIPFATDLYDQYDDAPVAVGVFAATLGLAGLVDWAMTAHIARRGFLHERHRARAHSGIPVALGISLVFFLSVPAAFISVYLAQLLWISVLVIRYPLRRLGRALDSHR